MLMSLRQEQKKKKFFWFFCGVYLRGPSTSTNSTFGRFRAHYADTPRISVATQSTIRLKQPTIRAAGESAQRCTSLPGISNDSGPISPGATRVESSHIRLVLVSADETVAVVWGKPIPLGCDLGE